MYRVSIAVALLCCLAASAAVAQAPNPPTNLQATAGTMRVDLSWQAPTQPPTVAQYRVYRSTTSGSGYSQIGTVNPPTTTYADTNVVAGQTYWYVVRSWNGMGGESANSNEASGTPQAPTMLDDLWVCYNDAGAVRAAARFVWTARNDVQHTYPGHPEWTHTHAAGDYAVTQNQTRLAPNPQGRTTYVELRVDSPPHVTITVTCPYSASGYWNEGEWVPCPGWEEPVGQDAVDIYAVDATENQSVDSRIDPRDPTRYLDYQFGSRVYRGGLFAGYNADGARVGRTYLKFPLAGLGGGTARLAVLDCWFVQGASTGASTANIAASLCSDNSWTENAIVWTNAPAKSTPLDAHDIAYDPQTSVEHWERWKVTAHVTTQLQAQATHLTEVLAATNESTVAWMYFGKRQYKENRQPVLLVAK